MRASPLPIVARTAMLTPTGREPQLVARMETLAVGAVERVGLLASVIPSRQLEEAIAEVDGILGQDFLSGLDHTLDYRRKRLAWSASSPAAKREMRLDLVPQDGRYLVELPQRDRVIRFVPDSGALGIVIFEGHRGAPIRYRELGQRVQLVSVTSARDHRMVVLERLEIGGETIENRPAVVVSRDSPNGPDGLLPLGIFTSVSFDDANRHLVIRW